MVASLSDRVGPTIHSSEVFWTRGKRFGRKSLHFELLNSDLKIVGQMGMK